MSAEKKIEHLIEETVLDWARDNKGKIAGGLGALGAGYLANNYIGEHPEFTNNVKMLGRNTLNTWTSDLPLSAKPTVNGVAWDNAYYNFRHDIDPEVAQAQGEIKLPSLTGQDKPFKISSDFIGIPTKGIQDKDLKDFKIYFDQDKYSKSGVDGLTFGS